MLGQGVSSGTLLNDPAIPPYTAPTVLNLSTHGSDLFVGGAFETVYNNGVGIPATNIAKVTWNQGQLPLGMESTSAADPIPQLSPQSILPLLGFCWRLANNYFNS